MKKIAFLVPAHNEEQVIKLTIEALLRIASKQDIYVVNDGSSDLTGDVASSLVPNVLNLYPNVGKATAMNQAITHYKLFKKYQYLMPMDADTIISQNFLDETLPILDQDKVKKITCVVGKVVGQGICPYTSYRLWEYEISQTIHKKAQSLENAIIVCPGCATIFRAEIFAKVKIPTGTITEDMDLTFLIHRLNLGQIKFIDKAIVITQDPRSIRDYLGQIDRWYTGFWQCVQKHNIPWGGQMLDMEVTILASEGIFYGLLSIFFIIFTPFIFLKQPHLIFLPLLLDLCLFVIPTVLLTSFRHNAWKIIKYIPMFYLLRFLGSLYFLKSFFKIVLGVRSLKWNKATRYDVNPVTQKLWLNHSIR